jgi:serine/threonine protein kinase
MIVAGTPQFMCPELINKKHYNPYRADVWAFGVLIYWMVLGYYPQDNCKKTKNLNKLVSFDLKFPVDMHPGIQYLIEKMLEPDPEQRIEPQKILENSWISPRNIKFEIQKLVNMAKS